MTRKRKLAVILIYISIIAAMLLMFFYVQKRYGHRLSKKRTEIPVTVFCTSPPVPLSAGREGVTRSILICNPLRLRRGCPNEVRAGEVISGG